MITDRPLKEVPTRALYALHRGIERQAGLIRGLFNNEGHVCGLGALLCSESGKKISHLGEHHIEAIYESIGLIHKDKNGFELTFVVAGLNDWFKGTREQRREFMLRHIVEELRQRNESLPKEHEKSTKILTHASQ